MKAAQKRDIRIKAQQIINNVGLLQLKINRDGYLALAHPETSATLERMQKSAADILSELED